MSDANRLHCALFRNNRSHAIRNPVEFERPGDAVTRRGEDRLVTEPGRANSLLELLAFWEPIDDEFPDIDGTLSPPRDVEM